MNTLYTERLILRGICLEDAEAYTRYFVDYDVIRYLSAEVPWPYPRDGVKNFLQHVIIPQLGSDCWA